METFFRFAAMAAGFLFGVVAFFWVGFGLLWLADLKKELNEIGRRVRQ